MVLLYELKAALANCEFELQSLRHQYEALNPGKVCYSKLSNVKTDIKIVLKSYYHNNSLVNILENFFYLFPRFGRGINRVKISYHHHHHFSRVKGLMMTKNFFFFLNPLQKRKNVFKNYAS